MDIETVLEMLDKATEEVQEVLCATDVAWNSFVEDGVRQHGIGQVHVGGAVDTGVAET